MKKLLLLVASTLVMIGCYAQDANPFFHELREAKRISLSDLSNLQGDGWRSVGKNLAKQTIAQ